MFPVDGNVYVYVCVYYKGYNVKVTSVSNVLYTETQS